MLILHSYHRPIEPYARDVALEIAKASPNGVIVRKSPGIRRFNRLSRQYDAAWVADLHSEKLPYRTRVEPEWLRNPLNPLAILDHGERWTGEYTGQLSLEGRRVHQLLESFCRENYSTDQEGRTHGVHLGTYSVTRSNPRFIHVGLLWFRPKDISVEFVKKLSEFLFYRPL